MRVGVRVAVRAGVAVRVGVRVAVRAGVAVRVGARVLVGAVVAVRVGARVLVGAVVAVRFGAAVRVGVLILVASTTLVGVLVGLVVGVLVRTDVGVRIGCVVAIVVDRTVGVLVRWAGAVGVARVAEGSAGATSGVDEANAIGVLDGGGAGRRGSVPAAVGEAGWVSLGTIAGPGVVVLMGSAMLGGVAGSVGVSVGVLLLVAGLDASPIADATLGGVGLWRSRSAARTARGSRGGSSCPCPLFQGR